MRGTCSMTSDMARLLVAEATVAGGRAGGGSWLAGGRRRVPGEARAVEAVLLVVAGDLSGRVVERERVQGVAAERDLGRAVRPGYGADPAVQRGRRCRDALLARDGQRRPDRLAGTARAQR